MEIVALLSGGKDSCFNLLHCAKHGHKLVAAASLGPEPGKDEIDSYLYQSVGQDAIQLVADALEVPLLRRVIQGTAVQQGPEYGSRYSLAPDVPGDETEDLYALLSEVKVKFPRVRGVSVGAILSNYQRVRVENRDQTELLSEMIDAGLEAVIIKVAGIGLTVSHLGKTLAQMQYTLIKLNKLYGAHICGEGGEYETLTLDFPLFKHRIVLDETKVVTDSDNAFATVAFLKITRASLQVKLGDSISRPIVSEPPTLSDADISVCEAVSCALSVSPSSEPIMPVTYESWKAPSTCPCCRQVGSWLAIGNVSSPHFEAKLSIEDEVRVCFDILKEYLAKHGLDLSHLANITILIASMDLLPAVNASYSSFFGTSPPARACIAVDLPPPTRVKLECIAHYDSQPQMRRSLHVQSLSYWAPPNIGPYSQAITVGERVFISGQIGLIPASNTLPVPQSLPKETALSLRHVRSIVNVVKDNLMLSWSCATQGIICWLVQESHISAIKSGMSFSDFHSGVTPTLFATIKSLPRDAMVEMQVHFHTARQEAREDDEIHMKLTPTYVRGKTPDLESCWEISSFNDDCASLAIVACSNNDDESALADKLRCVADLQKFWNKAICVRFFHAPNATPDIPRLLGHLCGPDNIPCITDIPCRSLATWDRDNWDYALYILA